jgi:dimethylhistidine N-methyltransferase
MPGYAYHDLLPEQARMHDDVAAGLSRSQKEIPPKYFYDARGCALFEEICGLPEYYLTRTELAVMRAHAGAMAGRLGPDCVLIEIGCGNSEKTRLLLDALRPKVFVPVDIAREQLETSCDALARSFPELQIVALRADFAQAVALPAAAHAPARRRLLYFPGSTIGNFTPAEAHAFLARWAPLLGAGGAALIGVDLKKDSALLDAAYNDAQGVTAAFNLNLLARCNRELGANFDLQAFRHHAFYNTAFGRVEMHIESLRDQRVVIGGADYFFRAGETIHTENSCKYSPEEFGALGRSAGYEPVECWMDDDRRFAVHYFVLPGAAAGR